MVDIYHIHQHVFGRRKFLGSKLADGFSVDMVTDKYPPFCFMPLVTIPSSVLTHWVRTHFQLVVFTGTLIKSGVFRLSGCRLRMPAADAEEAKHSRFAAETRILETQGAAPQALTLSRGAWSIAWRLRRPFLGECRRLYAFLESLGVCWLQSSAWFPQ